MVPEYRPRSQRGSVLMLVPAGVLVLVILGSIAVDSAIAFLGQRQLVDLASAVANDAATAALSQPAFYRTDGGPRIEIDGGAADRLVDEALVARSPEGIENLTAEVRVVGDAICVSLTGRVAYVFAKAIPGADDSATVTGRAAATAVEGAAGALVTRPSTC